MMDPMHRMTKPVMGMLTQVVAMKIGAVQDITELIKCFTNLSALDKFIRGLLAMDFLGKVDEWTKTTLHIMATCTTEPGAFLRDPTTIASLAACTTGAAAIALLRKLMKERARSASASTPAAIEDLGCAASDAAAETSAQPAAAPEADLSSGEIAAQDTTCDGADEGEADSTLASENAALDSVEGKVPEKVAAERVTPADEATAVETVITETATAPQVTEASSTAAAASASSMEDKSAEANHYTAKSRERKCMPKRKRKQKERGMKSERSYARAAAMARRVDTTMTTTTEITPEVVAAMDRRKNTTEKMDFANEESGDAETGESSDVSGEDDPGVYCHATDDEEDEETQDISCPFLMSKDDVKTLDDAFRGVDIATPVHVHVEDLFIAKKDGVQDALLRDSAILRVTISMCIYESISALVDFCAKCVTRQGICSFSMNAESELLEAGSLNLFDNGLCQQLRQHLSESKTLDFFHLELVLREEGRDTVTREIKFEKKTEKQQQWRDSKRARR